MLKIRVTLLQEPSEIPLRQLIYGISFPLTTYQHSRSQGRPNLNQPCLQRSGNETNKLRPRQMQQYFEANFYHHHSHRALLYAAKPY